MVITIVVVAGMTSIIGDWQDFGSKLSIIATMIMGDVEQHGSIHIQDAGGSVNV